MHSIANLSDSEPMNVSYFNANIKSIRQDVDAFFLLNMAFLIFFMQCGFAFLEVGFVRSKNVTSILIKNVLETCIASLCYYAVGYGLAMGEHGNFITGGGNFFLVNVPAEKYAYFFFEFTFCASASTIVTGALAERIEFVGYLVYAAALSSSVYPIISHWAWDQDKNGWLVKGVWDGVHFKDFAGSGVVHLHGGTVALVAALLIGPRIHSTSRPKQHIEGHSVPFAALGCFILMLGFFAFNGGSQGHISSSHDSSVVNRAVVSTMLCAAGASMPVLFFSRVTGRRKWSLLNSMNAILAGMVAACAGCDSFEPWAAVIQGVIGGVFYLALTYFAALIHLDDPLDAFAVHFGGGLAGILCAPILMNGGIVFTWSQKSFLQLAWNGIGAVAIILWSAFWAIIIFGILKCLRLLRVPQSVELEGLDAARHGECAYPRDEFDRQQMLDDVIVALREATFSKDGKTKPEEFVAEVCRLVLTDKTQFCDNGVEKPTVPVVLQAWKHKSSF